MQAKVKVQRYDPEKSTEITFQDYEVEVPNHFTVLDTLVKIREEVDPSLALRCSCRAAICGSCAMRVDDQARLACNTRLASVVEDGGEVKIEPMGNQNVVKDLVVDLKLFWDKVRDIEPYLQPDVVPEEEFIASNESMLNLLTPMGCIMCGACVSDCTALEVDKSFIGPAALAKTYRFVADPRDDKTDHRLGKMNSSGGVWDCTRCYMCVEVCPKGVAPMDRIMQMRDSLMESGVTNTPGARHVKSFEHSVSNSGWLDETMLAVDSWGKFNLPKLVGNLPLALRVLRRGKFPLPAPFHHKVPGNKNIKRIFERIDNSRD
ncbi:MAG: succinate dehydrogenase [Chloroflexi bacterium]|nr:succinate dehydrogenase [Chloroflexota bacterium]